MPVDELTKLHDRRELFARLNAELARTKRNRIPFSILLIDVDHFKEVNDNYGHLRGDRVLVETAQIIKENCREMDMPCRYGGDEFVLILPETDSYAAERVAQRLLRKLNSHTFAGYENQPDLHMSVSIGIATYPTDLYTPESMFEKADEALYLAKKKGRNRIYKDIDVTKEKKEPCLNFRTFVNRSQELSRLKRELDSVIKRKNSFIITCGEAGIGKTRLITELQKYGTIYNTVFLSSRPFEFGVTPPYHIFFQIIKQYIQESGKRRTQIFNSLQPVYKAELAKFIPDLRHAAIAGITPPELTPEQEKMRLFEAVFQILQMIAKKSTIIIFFDDLQWARKADFELLEYMVRNTANLPLLICGAYRIEEVDDKHPLKRFLQAMSREHRFEKVDLKGLSDDDTRQLLNSILNSPVPEDISTTIYNETKGNPYYVEEIIKSLVEEKIVFWNKTNWTFNELTKTALPSSVEDLLRRRFQGLDNELRELLTLASAIGNRFTLSLLQKITNMNEGHLFDLLDLGVRNLLIAIEPDDTYSFVNILLRRAFYKNIGSLKKRRLHLQIARCIEKQYEGRLPEAYENLAYHYFMAEKWEPAFKYNLKAAEQLKKIYANNDAISRYQICLDLLKQGKITRYIEQKKISIELAGIYKLIGNYDKAINYCTSLLRQKDLTATEKSQIMLQLGTIYERKSDYDKALSHYIKGKKILNKKEHSTQIAKLDLQIAWIYRKKAHYKKAFSLINKALKRFKVKKDNQYTAIAYNTIGTIYEDKGEWNNAERALKKSLGYIRKTGITHSIADVKNNLTNIYIKKSEFKKALKTNFEVLEIRKKCGDRYGLCTSYHNIANTYTSLGELQKSIEYRHKNIEIAKSLNNPWLITISYCNLGDTLLKTGNYEEAREYFTKAITLADRIGILHLVTLMKINLAEALLGLGKHKQALSYLKASEKICLKYGFKEIMAANYQLFADYYVELKQYDKARKYLRSAFNIARKMKDRRVHANILISSGRFNLTQGRLKRALTDLNKCMKISKSIKDDLTLARAYHYSGVIMKKKGVKKLAYKYLNQSRLIFERFGAKRFEKLVDSELKKL